MYKVKNVRHGKDLGEMDKETILSRWPQADLTGKQFRAGKFYITCTPPKKKATPKKKTENEG
jgi:hypothetical protein